MELLAGVFSAFGLSASAGLNAYIPLLVVALLARFTDLLELSPPWDALTNNWIIGLLVVLLVIEFFADKVPAVNHANDLIQTFVRPVAGAILFAGSAQVITDISPILSLAAGLFVAGGVHAVKSTAIRPTVSVATAGAGNIPVSIMEDLVSTVISFLSILIPILLMVLAVLIGLWIFFILRRRRKKVYVTNNLDE
ncbi:DUF4126 domain-containing protein, partial [Chloroflexota bacterium]